MIVHCWRFALARPHIRRIEVAPDQIGSGAPHVSRSWIRGKFLATPSPQLIRGLRRRSRGPPQSKAGIPNWTSKRERRSDQRLRGSPTACDCQLRVAAIRGFLWRLQVMPSPLQSTPTSALNFPIEAMASRTLARVTCRTATFVADSQRTQCGRDGQAIVEPGHVRRSLARAPVKLDSGTAQPGWSDPDDCVVVVAHEPTEPGDGMSSTPNHLLPPEGVTLEHALGNAGVSLSPGEMDFPAAAAGELQRDLVARFASCDDEDWTRGQLARW